MEWSGDRAVDTLPLVSAIASLLTGSPVRLDERQQRVADSNDGGPRLVLAVPHRQDHDAGRAIVRARD